MLTPRPGVVSAGKPTYPKAEPVAIAGAEATPAYRTTFRIVQPVTIAAAGHDVQISGVLNYQACDDRVCYPVAALPVTWTVAAR
jgi:hypothetical protein